MEGEVEEVAVEEVEEGGIWSKCQMLLKIKQTMNKN